MKRILRITGMLAVIAILAAIVAPNFLTALNRSRQKRTTADMRSIATAWEARANDVGSYSVRPSHILIDDHDMGNFLQTEPVRADDLKRALVPKYLHQLPTQDAWSHAFDFRTGDHDTKGQARGYAIRSLGRDGRPDAFAYSSRATKSFDEDIVYANGSFLWFPEGT